MQIIHGTNLVFCVASPRSNVQNSVTVARCDILLRGAS